MAEPGFADELLYEEADDRGDVDAAGAVSVAKTVMTIPYNLVEVTDPDTGNSQRIVVLPSQHNPPVQQDGVSPGMADQANINVSLNTINGAFDRRYLELR